LRADLHSSNDLVSGGTVVDRRGRQQAAPGPPPVDDEDVCRLFVDRELPGVHDHDHAACRDFHSDRFRKDVATRRTSCRLFSTYGCGCPLTVTTSPSTKTVVLVVLSVQREHASGADHEVIDVGAVTDGDGLKHMPSRIELGDQSGPV
jgi:hypothetical protein